MSADPRLQDYLDDRMSAAERAEFEAGLAHDPELADQVRSALAVRAALRGDAGELPEGFYERARARFEAARGASAAPRRRVPWEVVGLAAATLLVAVLFWYPRVPRDSRALVQTPFEDSAQPAREQDARNAAPPPFSPAPAETETATAEKRDEAGATATQPSVTARPVQQRPQAVPVGEIASVDVKEQLESRSAASEPAPFDSDGARREAKSSRVAVSEERLDDAAAELTTAALAKAAPRAPGAYGVALTTEPPARTIAIPAALLPHGSVRAIESESASEWAELLAGPARAQARKLAPDFAHERVVAIGVREPAFFCSGISFRIEPTETVIRLHVVARLDEYVEEGCLVVIPRGNQPIRIEPISAD